MSKICFNKDCVHEGKPQPRSNFSRCIKSKDGKQARCKDCYKEYRVRRSGEPKKLDWMKLVIG